MNRLKCWLRHLLIPRTLVTEFERQDRILNEAQQKVHELERRQQALIDELDLAARHRRRRHG